MYSMDRLESNNHKHPGGRVYSWPGNHSESKEAPPILKIAQCPLVTVSANTSVQETVDEMTRKNTGAAIIVEKDRPIGIFTEHDLLTRVVAEGRVPSKTRVLDVMTGSVKTIELGAKPEEAESLMNQEHFHFLPVVNEKGEVNGLLSILDLLRYRTMELNRENKTLLAYALVDGPGGD